MGQQGLHQAGSGFLPSGRELVRFRLHFCLQDGFLFPEPGQGRFQGQEPFIFRLGLVPVGQYLFQAASEFLFQPVQQVQPFLGRFQGLPVIMIRRQNVPQGLAHVFQGFPGRIHTFRIGFQLRRIVQHPFQSGPGGVDGIQGTGAAVFAPFQVVMGFPHRLEDLFLVAQLPDRFPELVIFSRLDMGFVDFLDFCFQPLQVFSLVGILQQPLFHGFPGFVVGHEFFLVFFQQGLEPWFQVVQDGESRPGGQQGLVLVLAVDVHQLAGQTGEHVHRHLPLVYKSLALAPGSDLPAEEQGVFPQIQIQFPEDVMDIFQPLDVEHRLDPVEIRPFPQVVPAGPAAQYNAEGVDQDGFPGAGFPGEHIEPRGKVHPQMIDQGKIVHFQGIQHVSVLSWP